MSATPATGTPPTRDSVQEILKDKRETYQSKFGEIVDIFELGNLFIIELGTVEFSLLIIYFVISLAAISLGIVALSNWVSGNDYKGSASEESGFDIASYIVSGIAILLGTIFFGMFLSYYLTRKARVDETLLTAKSDAIRAAVLTKRYGKQIDKSLPAHSQAIMAAVTSETQQAADRVLATEYGTAGVARDADGNYTTVDARIGKTKDEYDADVAAGTAAGREAGTAAGREAGVAEGTAEGRTLQSEEEAEQRQQQAAQAQNRKIRAELTAAKTRIEELEAEQTAQTAQSPISLSQTKRRKSPSSLKKKKKPSPSSLKKKKASPSSLKKKKASPSSLKKKSTSSRRK